MSAVLISPAACLHTLNQFVIWFAYREKFGLLESCNIECVNVLDPDSDVKTKRVFMSEENEDLAHIEIPGEDWVMLAAVAWRGYQLHGAGVVILELSDEEETSYESQMTSPLYYLPSDTPELKNHIKQNQKLAQWLSQYDPQLGLILGIAHQVGVFYSYIETPISYPSPPQIIPQEDNEIADAMNFKRSVIVNDWPILSGISSSKFVEAERNIIVVEVHDVTKTDINNAVEQALKNAENDFIRALQENAPTMLSEQRAFRAGFESRLAQRWSKPFDLFETILTLCQEAGSTLNRKHQEQSIKGNDLIFLVLIRLHARACLTASEVFALLRTGHASGANARWRTLHEIVVVAYFIKKFGLDVAERYLEHEHIEAFKAAQEYQRHCNRLGFEHFERSEMKALKGEYDRVVSKYGEEFKQDYGWAANALDSVDPSHGGRATFTRIENAVDLDHWRPHYGMANYGIHAGTKGITFNLGLFYQGQALLAGPSNTGLADPGQCACISLLQITTTVASLKPDVENVVVMKVLQQFVMEARDTFVEVQQKIEEDEDSRK